MSISRMTEYRSFSNTQKLTPIKARRKLAGILIYTQLHEGNVQCEMAMIRLLARYIVVCFCDSPWLSPQSKAAKSNRKST